MLALRLKSRDFANCSNPPRLNTLLRASMAWNSSSSLISLTSRRCWSVVSSKCGIDPRLRQRLPLHFKIITFLLHVMPKNARTGSNTGGMHSFSVGPKTKTSGGWAPKFYTAVRIELVPLNAIKKGDDTVARDIKAVVRKNEFHRPDVAVTYRLRFQ